MNECMCVCVCVCLGDFFKDPLPEADLYILARILHDWTDQRCIELLSSVYKACKPGLCVCVCVCLFVCLCVFLCVCIWEWEGWALFSLLKWDGRLYPTMQLIPEKSVLVTLIKDRRAHTHTHTSSWRYQEADNPFMSFHNNVHLCVRTQEEGSIHWTDNLAYEGVSHIVDIFNCRVKFLVVVESHVC